MWVGGDGRSERQEEMRERRGRREGEDRRGVRGGEEKKREGEEGEGEGEGERKRKRGIRGWRRGSDECAGPHVAIMKKEYIGIVMYLRQGSCRLKGSFDSTYMYTTDM